MVNLRKLILRWRFDDGGLLKTTIGFWAKRGYESLVMVGIPIYLFLLLVEVAYETSAQSLPLIPEVDIPLELLWLLISTVSGMKLSCLLSSGTDYPDSA